MKILSIGNSFSTDAHHFLHSIAKSMNVDITTANLYIGGCSLEKHVENLENCSESYDYEINGGECQRKISINEAIELEKWDIITLQQASHYSGKPQTYIPYLQKLAEYVREKSPASQIYIHQTWAYDKNSTHPQFVNYNCNQNEMYARLIDANEMAAKLINAKIIPVGMIIQKLRNECDEFNTDKGGLSLCRDGFHMSYLYGRYAAALTWFATLTGKKVNEVNFIPEYNNEKAQKCLIDKINNMVNSNILNDL